MTGPPVGMWPEGQGRGGEEEQVHGLCGALNGGEGDKGPAEGVCETYVECASCVGVYVRSARIPNPGRNGHE